MGNRDTSLVSFNHDRFVNYGGRAPHGASDNPAYGFVWRAVERLGLGPRRNPLQGLIEPGHTVLVKPNLVGYQRGAYSRPEVVAPLVDMAVAAGAARVRIGDAGNNFLETEETLARTGYSELARCLQSRNPSVRIETVNLNRLPAWRWVCLGKESSLCDSGYGDDDLGAGHGRPLLNHRYYLNPDPSGRSPGGRPLGWYAISDVALDADVVINVPKMKTHWTMIATLSLKNLVGCTVASTYDLWANGAVNMARIPHCHVRGTSAFENDVAARVLQDLNRLVLYCDKKGELRTDRQRRYLTVIDGIEAMERGQTSLHHAKGRRRMCHVVVAGQDPVSTDMVACRAMGYDFRQVPVLREGVRDDVRRIGNYDPERIAVVGEDLDEKVSHVFRFNDRWKKEARLLAVTKLAPPKIRRLEREGSRVMAGIDGCTAAHLMEGDGPVRAMDRDGDWYVAEVPSSTASIRVLAHDEHLNATSKTWDLAAGPFRCG